VGAARVYIEFLIVMSYVMLFLSTQGLAKHAGSDIGEFLLLLAVIVLLYVLWGAGQIPIAGARVEFHHGSDFASLWGGGTLPAWRGRGVFRSPVAYRAV